MTEEIFFLSHVFLLIKNRETFLYTCFLNEWQKGSQYACKRKKQVLKNLCIFSMQRKMNLVLFKKFLDGKMAEKSAVFHEYV